MAGSFSVACVESSGDKLGLVVFTKGKEGVCECDYVQSVWVCVHRDEKVVEEVLGDTII